MTQDEVDLIYDYLHENYEYWDGELIAKKTTKGIKKGRALGHFSYRRNGHPIIQGRIKINGKSYLIDVRKLIFIYHNKYDPKFVINKDGNILNSYIENLMESQEGLDSYEKKSTTK